MMWCVCVCAPLNGEIIYKVFLNTQNSSPANLRSSQKE